MATVIGILQLIVGLVSLVCWILVLIKQFKNEGALHGILGIVCGLYALVKGWMNKDEWDVATVVYVWTGAIVVNIILNIVANAVA